MKLTHLALCTGLVFGSAGASAVGGPLDLSSGSTGFSSTPVAGLFSDLYTFTLGMPSFLTASLTSVVNGTQDIDFNVVALSGPSGFFPFNQVLADPFETYTLSTGLLAAGSYTLILAGMNSPSIASYAGNIAVTPIPEPQTFALLAAGLLSVGFLSRRRSS